MGNISSSGPEQTFNAAPSPSATASTRTPKERRNSGGVKAKAPAIDMYQPGRLRVANLLALYGIASANTLYTWMRQTRIPPPDGHDPRPYWLTSTIREHLEGRK